MLARDVAKVLADAETLGLLPPEKDVEKLADRARVWGWVLGEMRVEDANGALSRIVRQNLPRFMRPNDLIRVAGDIRWLALSKAERERDGAAAREHYRLMGSDPDYRARYERAVEEARANVRSL